MVLFGGAPDTDEFRHRIRLYQGVYASPDKSLRTRRRPTMDGSPFLPLSFPHGLCRFLGRQMYACWLDHICVWTER